LPPLLKPIGGRRWGRSRRDTTEQARRIYLRTCSSSFSLREVEPGIEINGSHDQENKEGAGRDMGRWRSMAVSCECGHHYATLMKISFFFTSLSSASTNTHS